MDNTCREIIDGEDDDVVSPVMPRLCPAEETRSAEGLTPGKQVHHPLRDNGQQLPGRRAVDVTFLMTK